MRFNLDDYMRLNNIKNGALFMRCSENDLETDLCQAEKWSNTW
jgi:hypothetical protein